MKIILYEHHDFMNEETAYVLDAGLVYNEPFEVPSIEWFDNFIKNAPCPLMFSKDVMLEEGLILLEHPYSF